MYPFSLCPFQSPDFSLSETDSTSFPLTSNDLEQAAFFFSPLFLEIIGSRIFPPFHLFPFSAAVPENLSSFMKENLPHSD